jgi:hypothetical protein
MLGSGLRFCDSPYESERNIAAKHRFIWKPFYETVSAALLLLTVTWLKNKIGRRGRPRPHERHRSRDSLNRCSAAPKQFLRITQRSQSLALGLALSPLRSSALSTTPQLGFLEDKTTRKVGAN